MRFIVRWLFRLLVLALVLATALLLLKDLILREVLANRLRSVTGLEVRLEKFEVGLLSPTVTLEGLRFYNPPAFGGSVFLDLPEIHFEYDRDSMTTQRFRLRLVRLELAELNLVEDTAGRLNYDVIGAMVKERTQPAAMAGFAFGGVDTLNLSVGRITRSSLKNPGKLDVLNVDVRNEVLTRLNTPQDLMLGLGKLAMRVGLRELSNRLGSLGGAGSTTPAASAPAKRPAPRR